jgi:hypothetical protein
MLQHAASPSPSLYLATARRFAIALGQPHSGFFLAGGIGVGNRRIGGAAAGELEERRILDLKRPVPGGELEGPLRPNCPPHARARHDVCRANKTPPATLSLRTLFASIPPATRSRSRRSARRLCRPLNSICGYRPNYQAELCMTVNKSHARLSRTWCVPARTGVLSRSVVR